MMLARTLWFFNRSWRSALLGAFLFAACLTGTLPTRAANGAVDNATSPPTRNPAPAAAPAPAACCRSTDDFPWQDLPASGQSLEVVIDSRSPTYQFHAGESRFVAFRLPMATGPYRIELRALPTAASGVPGGWYVFYPEAVMLDGDHLVSRTAPAENLVLEPVGGELAPGGAYTLFLPVDPATDGEKFLVIYTAPNNAAPEAKPQFLQARGAAMRAAGNWHAGASDIGRLRISVVASAGASR
jgi:hypothetical protein